MVGLGIVRPGSHARRGRFPAYGLTRWAALHRRRSPPEAQDRVDCRFRPRRPVPMQTLLSDDEIASLNLDFEGAQPSDILAWALEKSGLEHIAIASAFQ